VTATGSKPIGQSVKVSEYGGDFYHYEIYQHGKVIAKTDRNISSMDPGMLDGVNIGVGVLMAGPSLAEAGIGALSKVPTLAKAGLSALSRGSTTRLINLAFCDEGRAFATSAQELHPGALFRGEPAWGSAEERIASGLAPKGEAVQPGLLGRSGTSATQSGHIYASDNPLLALSHAGVQDGAVFVMDQQAGFSPYSVVADNATNFAHEGPLPSPQSILGHYTVNYSPKLGLQVSGFIPNSP
jgi:hypothetical protein